MYMNQYLATLFGGKKNVWGGDYGTFDLQHKQKVAVRRRKGQAQGKEKGEKGGVAGRMSSGKFLSLKNSALNNKCTDFERVPLSIKGGVPAVERESRRKKRD